MNSKARSNRLALEAITPRVALFVNGLPASGWLVDPFLTVSVYVCLCVELSISGGRTPVKTFSVNALAYLLDDPREGSCVWLVFSHMCSGWIHPFDPLAIHCSKKSLMDRYPKYPFAFYAIHSSCGLDVFKMCLKWSYTSIYNFFIDVSSENIC